MRRSHSPLQKNCEMTARESKSSSIEKGNDLENSVYKQVLHDISAGIFGFDPSCCRPFQKKGYFSKDRGSNIIFDITIEVWMPEATDWFLLIVFECKNYSHKVPVDDIEEFFQKVEQIGPAATKAIVVSSNAFQSGAISFAKSKRMGLARHFPESQLEWVLHRSPSTLRIHKSFISSTDDSEAMSSDTYVSRYFDYHCVFGNERSISLSDLILTIMRSLPDLASMIQTNTRSNLPEEEQVWVPFLPSNAIEDVSRKFARLTPQSDPTTALEDVCLLLQKERGLTISDSNLPKGVLATVSFDPLKIEIDRTQSSTEPRRRFTLAHELGHICLEHGEFMRRDTLRDQDTAIDPRDQSAIPDIARLEWQANYFAACLLLPRRALMAEVERQAKKLGITNRGFGLLYLDEQRCNKMSFLALSSAITERFKVSREVVRLRLLELGVLREVSPAKQLNQVGTRILHSMRKANPPQQ
jgi:Zn-dependent peptidase ImmA (M78 family)